MAGFILPQFFRGGYRIPFSADFVRASTGEMTKTVGAPTDQRTWSLLLFAKFDQSGNDGIAGSDAGASIQMTKNSSDKLTMSLAGNQVWTFGTTISTATWYHICFVMDLFNATPAERMRCYLTGIQEGASISGGVSSGDNPSFNSNGVTARFGRTTAGFYAGGADYHDGPYAQMAFLDGVAITDPIGQGWLGTGGKPIDISGNSFAGNNSGLYMFGNSGALGADTSGNGNDLTVSGTVNQSTDVPA